MSAKHKPDEPILEYISRVQDNVTKPFPKLADWNRQDLTVSKFCQGIGDPDVARMTTLKAKDNVASAQRIATSATALGRNQQYSQR